MSDWGGEPVPGVRFSPADHYDQAVQILEDLPVAATPDTVNTALLEVIGQALLGLLRSRMEER